MNSRPRIAVERLADAIADGRTVAISALSPFELAYGVAKSRQVERNVETLRIFLEPLQVLSFDAEDGQAAGKIRAEHRSVPTTTGLPRRPGVTTCCWSRLD